MTRFDGRAFDQLRDINITTPYIKHAEGSCLIEFGETRVVCTASVEDKVPPFLTGSGQGWVTAEYGMLPRSCTTRIRREKAMSSGRTMEIQRLIGRSLRSVVDMKNLGERTIKVDCDVLQADGGTRTAAISGGFVALAKALEHVQEQDPQTSSALIDYVGAISVGIKDGQMLLDLNYEEDSTADMDMNVVMLGSGLFVEIQGTAEGQAYSKDQWNDLVSLAQSGIESIVKLQKEYVGHLLV